MNGRAARGLRKLIKDTQDTERGGLDVLEERGLRAYPIEDHPLALVDNITGKFTQPFYQVVNPEKNYYRGIKRRYTRTANNVK